MWAAQSDFVAADCHGNRWKGGFDNVDIAIADSDECNHGNGWWDCDQSALHMWINLVLARRPSQSTPTKQVKMSVEYALASIGASVKD